MGDRLIVHLDLPSAVVGDDDQHGRLVTYGRIDLDGIEAERTVPCRHDDRAIREGEARGNAVGHADANTPERTGIEHGRRVQPDAGEAQEIAAVGDHDGVAAHGVLEGRKHLVRMQACRRCRPAHSPCVCRSLRARSSWPARNFAAHCLSTDEARVARSFHQGA